VRVKERFWGVAPLLFLKDKKQQNNQYVLELLLRRSFEQKSIADSTKFHF